MTSWNLLKTIYRYPGTADGLGYEIQIGYWSGDGWRNKPVLVKRRFKRGVSGYEKFENVPASFEPGDVWRIADNIRLIAELMDFPLPSDIGIFKEEPDFEVKKGEQLELST